MSDLDARKRREAREACRHTLYRLFDGDGTLLYVGITYRRLDGREGRLQGHKQDKAWWPLVSRVTEEMHPNRAAAEEAESAAIDAESPRFNRITGTYLADAATLDPKAWRDFRLAALECGDGVPTALAKAIRQYRNRSNPS